MSTVDELIAKLRERAAKSGGMVAVQTSEVTLLANEITSLRALAKLANEDAARWRTAFEETKHEVRANDGG